MEVPQKEDEIIKDSEVATHLLYLRRDFREQKAQTKENFDKLESGIDKLATKLDNMKDGYVPLSYFREHEKRDDEHELRLNQLEEKLGDYKLLRGVVWGATGFILIAVLSAIVYLVVQK